jgi:malonyl-CoA/methylmalonyl-CoA synthetase
MGPHFLAELRESFARNANRSAVRGRSGIPISYDNLANLARYAAAALQGHGMRPGDRVLLCTPHKLPFLIAHLGVLFGGGVSVPLNPRFTREELRYFLKDSGASVAVASPAVRDVLESLRSDCPGLRTVLRDYEDVANAPKATPQSVQPDGEAPCLMIYSSGTTGQPKGIVHTNANVAASLRALQACWRVTADDVIVNVLPLFHVHGLSFATQLTLLAGGCVHIEEAFDSDRTVEAIGRGTVFMAVPTIYYRLLDHPGFPYAARHWKDVRLFTCGSAPIRPEVLPALESILGRPVINRYGMSEAHVITSLPLDGPWPQGSVGVPIDGIEMRLATAEGESAAVGAVGRIYVRGPNLFRGYWQQPEATRQAFATGWFDTGDLGTLDANGFLTLVGRSNDLIITNGFNVYPPVVERAINTCPGVRECAVFGVPDRRRGERVVAVVVRADPALDEARLMAELSERLVDYQRPRTVMFVEELPRNTMGKVLRRVLRDQVIAQYGDDAGGAT